MTMKTSQPQGFILSTRESFSRKFIEFGVVEGQSFGSANPVREALKHLAKTGEDLGYDGVIAIRLHNYDAGNGQVTVAYGTAIKWLELQKH